MNAARIPGRILSYNHTISADGRYVSFESSTSTPTNAALGFIFRQDLQSGTTQVVHTNADVPLSPFPEIRSLSMTPDGRFIAFVANTNGAFGNSCIYLWDAQTAQSILVSGDLTNSVPTNSICDRPRIDDSGRRITFLSSAPGLVTTFLAGTYNLYVRDIQAGTTSLINTDENGIAQPVGPLATAEISADGSYVVFERNDNNQRTDLFLRDSLLGGVTLISTHHPTLVPLTGTGTSTMTGTSLSGDGRLLVFTSEANDLVQYDYRPFRDVFIRDLATGINKRISVGTNGGDGSSSEASISPDGRYVAFSSTADDLVPGDNNGKQDVFVHDLQAGTNVLASASVNGTPGNNSSYAPVIFSGGRYLLFKSRALNLTPNSLGANENLFLRDLQLRTNWVLTRFGVSSAAWTPDGNYVAFVGNLSTGPGPRLYVWDTQAKAIVFTNAPNSLNYTSSIAIRDDGRMIAYSLTNTLVVVDRIAGTKTIIGPRDSVDQGRMEFSADGRFLVFGSSLPQSASDTNNTYDVFLYDFQSNTKTLLSRSLDQSGAGNAWSDSPSISGDGSFIAFRSVASNLVPGVTSGLPELYLYDRVKGSNTLLSANLYGVTSGNHWPINPSFQGSRRNILIFSSWGSGWNINDLNQTSDVFRFSLPYMEIFNAGGFQSHPFLTWPASPGTNYRVEYKESLQDPAWLPLSGSIVLNGDRASLQDNSVGSAMRFYRVTTF
jgi:Tol biopolymer transport system component